MPRDKKTRGSRGSKKKQPKPSTEPTADAPAAEEEHLVSFPEPKLSSSWMHSAEEAAAAYKQDDKIYYSLDPEVQQYFKSVEKTLEGEFNSAYDRQLFLQNIFTEVEGKEVELATEHDCSRILEKILRVSSDFELRVFFDKLNGRFRELFVHRFASHVCQTLITLAAVAVDREMKVGPSKPPTENGEDAGILLSVEDLIINMCKQILPEWSTLMADPYASHILRVIICVLSGEPLVEESSRGGVRSKKSAKYNAENNNKADLPYLLTNKDRPVPASFGEMMKKVLKEMSENVSDVVIRTSAGSPVASPVIQMLLTMEPKYDSVALLDRVLMGMASESSEDALKKNIDRDGYVETLLKDQIGSHLFEKIVQVAPTELFLRLYSTYFRGRLARLCAHPIANYVVQHLLSNAKAKVMLELMVNEVVPEFEGYLANRRSGVIRSIIESSVRLAACEKEVIQGLCKAYHAPTPVERKEFVFLVLRMQTYEDYMATKDEKRTFDTQGALILQKLLEYPEEYNRIVLDSFLSQPANVTFPWTMDPIGSRLVEAILTSTTVDFKVKKKILRGFEGRYHEMAVDKYGGHTVDKCWAVADMAMKEKIAAELVEHERTIASSFHGKYILRNCRIENFKQKREEWKQREQGTERKKEMFRDIIGDTIVVKKNEIKGAKKATDALGKTGDVTDVLEAIVATTKKEKGGKKRRKDKEEEEEAAEMKKKRKKEKKGKAE